MLRRAPRFRFDLLRTIWHVGAPVSGERVVQQAGILLYTKIVLMYGPVAYAAHQVGLSIESLSFLPGYGFAIAAATMVGQSIGAGKYTRAKLEKILSEGSRFVGAAPEQVDTFLGEVARATKGVKGAAAYQPGKLL